MALFGNEGIWYTDIFSVYRNKETTKNGVTNFERQKISEKNFGRIYRKSSPSLNRTQQAAEYSINDNLICPISVDIQAGDEIQVIRGYRLGKNKNKIDKYIAGVPVDYYEPFGGVSPLLEHKQIPLQYEGVAGVEDVGN